MDDILKEARRLRKLGFAVHWLKPKTKIPLLPGWSDAIVLTEKELEDSYRPGLNVGFRPGKWSIVDGFELCVLDVDIRGGKAYAEEAYAAAAAMLGETNFNVISGSGVGRHSYLNFQLGKSPSSAATTLRQSDIWIRTEDGRVCPPGTPAARPAWLIEILSTGKNVVLPPSIHPDTGKPYKFIN